MTPANITSSNPVSSHDVSNEGKQAAANESDLKVWQEGSSSKARKTKKKKSRSGASDKPFSGASPCASRYLDNPAYPAVQEQQTRPDRGLKSRHCQRSTKTAASPDVTARGRDSSDFQLVARPELSKANLTPAEFRPRYKTPLVDIGANLIGHRFDDLSRVIADASRSGVGRIMITGTSIALAKKVQKTVDKWLKQSPHSTRAAGACASADSSRCSLYYTVGCHPHKARNFKQDGGIPEMEKIIERGGSHCIAVGECGLDFVREWSPKNVQRDVFREQLELAVQLKKPLFLHERGAHKQFIEILTDYINQLPSPAMACVHCFTGNSEQLQAYLDLGCSIGITGWIGNTRNKDLVGALRSFGWEALRDRLMVETDAPFLKPYLVMPRQPDHGSGGRGKRQRDNEPANLPYVIHALSQVLGVDGEEIAAATTENARRIFSLVD
ncbi:TatD family hydrolase [Endozoicomonas sp. ALB115]|uniref:TatD family hydrolase n=1 Tax=Endozoicomonas sp. ALB115 TaxID=3403074 RepID=UPI003BB6682E